ALRVIPLLHRLGLTSLTITYRNDTGAPASADRMHHQGLAEWEDTDAAIEYAVRRGARRIVLKGWSMGGGLAPRTPVASVPRHRAAGTASHAPAGPVDDDLPARREDGAPARTAGAARDETRVPRRPPGPPDPAVPRAGRCHGPTRPEPPAGRSAPRPGGVRA